MHIGIPFDIETVKQSWGQAARMWGRVMGNHTFLKALAGADGCSRLTLFVPGRQDVQVLARTLLPAFGASQAKVSAVPFAGIRDYLASTPLDVMHMLDPNMWLAAHIRARLSPRPFPVTGVTHSLGNQHFLEWALLNNANGVRDDDCLVCSTPTAQAVIRSVFGRLAGNQPQFIVPRTTVIPFGVPVANFAGSAQESRAQLALPADTFLVTSLARFNPQFKMDLVPVLRLAALVSRRIDRPVKFILAGSSGDGDYVRYLRDLAREEGLESVVEIAADPDETRKMHLLRAADAFLSLSDNIQETFGLTPIEAMAAGVPVVASDWDGYRSLVEDGVSGFLVPTCGLAPDESWEAAPALRYDSLVHLFSAQATAVDLDIACERLVRLAGDPALRERMGAAASVRARLFDWDVVIRQYLSLWEGMLAARRADGQGAAPPSAARSSAMRFVADFESYVTAALGAEDRFRTTDAGKALARGKAPVRLYFETDEFLDRGLMAAIVERCQEGRSVGQLVELLQGGAPGGARQLRQNILWLYKYGFLRAVRS